MTAVLGFAAGVWLAGSLLLLVAACRGWRPRRPTAATRVGEWLRGSALPRRLLLACGAGFAVALVTRWPVMAAAAVAVVLVWPAMFGAARTSATQIGRVEAVAVWTESLRDTIAGSIALEEAIRNTAGAAPPAIQPQLQRLLGALAVNVPLGQALAGFAEDFEDESIDLVAAALILNSQLRGPGLVATLTALATSAREELDMRRRIEEERKSLRRDARIIMATALGFAAVLAVFSRDYMAPYATVTGQLMLTLVVGLFAAGLVWMRRLADVRSHERFLIGPETLAARAAAARVGVWS